MEKTETQQKIMPHRNTYTQQKERQIETLRKTFLRNIHIHKMERKRNTSIKRVGNNIQGERERE